MKHNYLFLILVFLFPFFLTAQETPIKKIKSASKIMAAMTYVPDDNFEQALINLGYDSGELNDSVPTANISNLTKLIVNGKNISDLTGIEDFSALRTLNCDQNQLKSINISNNTGLLTLYCSENQLSSIDLSKNKALLDLSCYNNQLTSLDVSQNTALNVLHCNGNQLTNLDASQNLALNVLDCRGNEITNIDVTNNTALISFYCSGPQITNLDLSKNEKLSRLQINNTSITSLDLSNNTVLKYLYCQDNQLTRLDISACSKLETLWCYDNELTNLILGANSVLETIFCERNQLTSLVLSQATALSTLGCTSNQLTNLDLSKNTALNVLWCNSNELNNLDVGQNATITSINCRDNQLKSINLPQTTSLTGLYCQDNRLTFEDLEPAISISRFTYSPQDSVGTEIITTKKEGEDYSYSLSVGGAYNQYQWYKDGLVLPNQISAVLNLTNLTLSDAGVYHCEITNTVVTELTLNSRNITININAENNNPTDIILSKNNIDENKPTYTEVGILSTIDKDSEDTFIYSLILGIGDDDNDKFTISDNKLQTNESFNYESKNSYSIRIQTIDSGGKTLSKSFTISINNENEPPIDILLSNDNINENEQINTEVATLSSTDEDSGDTFTYSLVSGNGDDDNNKFTISDNKLQTNESFNYETKNSYTLRIQTIDSGGATFSKSFIISINNINEPPVNLLLSNINIDENLEPGTFVGIFSTIDEDTSDVYEYNFYPGEGDIDNASFKISKDSLFTNTLFDYESKSELNIRILASNSLGDEFNKTFIINIIDAFETEIETFLNNNIIKTYPNPFSSELNIEWNWEGQKNYYHEIAIYDIHGKIVKTFSQELLEGFNRLIWDATDENGYKIKPGTYLIHIKSYNKNEIFKIVYKG